MVSKNMEDFMKDANLRERYTTKLVMAIKLPSGVVELIINTENIQEKVGYYYSAYDSNLRLKTNSEISIVGWLFA